MKTAKLLTTLIFIGQLALAQIPVLYQKLQHPESVITDGRFIYVADIGKTMEPMAKDGDGAIRKLSLKGELISSNIAKTILHAPKGMAIIKGVLYCADVDRIVGISLSTGKLVREINFTKFKTLLVNDVVAVNDSILYATATDINKVFKIIIGPTNSITELSIPPLIGANGICYDKKLNRIYIVGLGSFTDKIPAGRLGYVSLKDGGQVYSPISAPVGFYDGVTILNDSTIIATDWRSLQKAAGEMFRINVKTGKSTRINLPRSIAGPADIWLDQDRHRLLIPEMLTGKILSYELK